MLQWGLDLRSFFIWSVTLCMILSFVLAAFLCIHCVLYLWRTNRRIGMRRELVKHIGAIAGADACMAAWSYMGSALHSESFLVHGDPEWCVLFTTVRMWLILLSALWTGALALGTLAALLGRDKQVRVLRYTAIGVVPLSVVLCVYNLFQPCHLEVEYDGSMDCAQSETTVTIESIEQTLILAFVVVVLVLSQRRARMRPRESIESRSIRIVSRYLLAYMLSYGCWILARWPLLNRLFRTSPRWPIFVSLAWRLLVLNGAFNFAALWLHARDAVRDLSHPLHIPILAEDVVSTVEVKRVDQRSLERAVKADLAEIQNANQRTWRELGLSYEEGVMGEAVSGEDRADHFSSILNYMNYSAKLQHATVI